MRRIDHIRKNGTPKIQLVKLFVVTLIMSLANSSLLGYGDMNTGGDASNNWAPDYYATTLSPTISGTGTIGGYNDYVDHYRFAVSAHQFVRVSLNPAYSNVGITVFGPGGAEQKSMTVNAGQSATIVGYANTSGYMYVRLYFATGSPTYYSLSILTCSPQQMDVSWQSYMGLTPVNPPASTTTQPAFWSDFFNSDGSLGSDVDVIGGTSGAMISTNVSPGTLIQHLVWSYERGEYDLASWEGDIVSGNTDYGDSNGGSRVSVSGNRGSAYAELTGKLLGKEAGITVEASLNSSGVTVSVAAKFDGQKVTYTHTAELVEFDPFNIHEDTQKQFVLWGIPFNIGLEAWGSAEVKADGKIEYGVGGIPEQWIKAFNLHASGILGASPSLALGVDNNSFAVEAGVEVVADILNAKFDYSAGDCSPTVHRIKAAGTLSIGALDFALSLYAKLNINNLLPWLNYKNKIKWTFYDPAPFAGQEWNLVESGEATYDPPLPGP